MSRQLLASAPSVDRVKSRPDRDEQSEANMAVIDVDLHFDVVVSAEEHPLRDMRDFLPSAAAYLADAFGGDLRIVTPPADAPPDEILAAFLPAENRSSGEFAAMTPDARPEFSSFTPADRLEWFERAGIDFALVNPGAIGILACFLDEEHRGEAMRRCNDFHAERLEGYTDRLSPVALIDWRDLDGAVVELTRMRAAGSRAFWVRAEPYAGMSPAHPHWDRVWSSATDLGMIAILHVGNTPAAFGGGWGNAGWNQPGGTGLGGFFRYANSMRHQAAEMMLAGMLYGGVFGRHPNLTVITEELGIGWLPYFVARCDSLSAGPWPFALAPGEMIRRNLRAAPLPGLGDPIPLPPALQEISEMLVFSSDYPHGEGSADPVRLFEPVLADMSVARRAEFLGGNVADCFARMGDPLPR
jgi:predicted TIM-barrel fold metal-dependent hydrolase